MRVRRNRSTGRIIWAAVAAAFTAGPVMASNLVWDASGLNPTNPTDGGGQWSTSVANWSNGSTEVDWPSQGNSALFGDSHGAAGPVMVASPVTVTGITFNAASSGNYNIEGSNTITLTGSTPTITINGAVAPTISAPMVGSSGLTITGTGVLTLNDVNSYSGATNVSGGTLVLDNSASLGSGALMIGTGGTVNVNVSTNLSSTAVNSGSLTIAPGQVLNPQYYGFNQTSGTLSILGSLTLSGGSFDDLGGTITGTVTLNGSGTVYFGPAAPGGKFSFTGATVNGYVYGTTSAVNVAAGAVINAGATNGNTNLNINPNTSYGSIAVTSAAGYNSSLSIPSGFTNHGIITLSALGSPSSLASVSSALTNAADGTVNINTSTRMNGTPVNSGTFIIASGALLDTQYYGFNQAAGTLSIGGALNLSGGTFNDLGGTITGTVTLNGSGSVYFSATAPGGNFNFTGTAVSAYVYGTTSGVNIPGGAIVQAGASGGYTNLNINPNASYGSITLTSAAGYNASLAAPSGFINHGVITLAASGTPSSPASIGSALTNAADGTININTSTRVNGMPANAGTFSIASGAVLDTQYYGFNQSGGTLSIGGSLNLSGGTFNDLGGTITGTVTLNGSGTVYFSAAAPGGNFNFTGGTVSGYVYGNAAGVNVPAGALITAGATGGNTSLNINPNTSYGSITVTSAAGYNSSVTIPSGFINHGVFTLAALGSPSSPGSINSGFTNPVDGTVNLNTSTRVAGTVTNTGSFNIASGAALDVAYYGFNQNGGSLSIGGSLNVSGGTFNDLGGTITGTVTLNGSGTVYFSATAPGGNFNFTGGTVSGYVYGNAAGVNVPAGALITAGATGGNTSLNINPNTSYGSITVTSAAGYNSSLSLISSSGFTNHGILQLGSLGTPSSPMYVSTGFTNAADGSFNISASTKVNGALVSAGLVNVEYQSTLDLTTTTPGLNISGGTVTVAAYGSTVASLKLNGLYWPATTAATAASITTDVIGSSTVSGRVDLNGNTAAAIDIENPTAVLTISTNVIDGGINKLGPGTLVLGGYNAYTGNTTISAGKLTLVKGESIQSLTVTVAAGATFNDYGYLPNATIVSQGTVNFSPPGSPVPSSNQFAVLTIPAGQKTTITAPSAPGTRSVLLIDTLNLAGAINAWTSTLDITGNDLDLGGASLATVSNQIRQGYNLVGGGNWSGTGITSSTAAGDPTHLTAVGVIRNGQAPTQLYSSANPFDGYVPAPGDILVKYTYFGDSNLDGKVDGSDYTLIDAGYASHGTLTGWYNGDYNYDGSIDGSDYALIDNTFNNQTRSLSAAALTAESTAQAVAPLATEPSSTVPEPGLIAVLAATFLWLTSRWRTRAGSNRSTH